METAAKLQFVLLRGNSLELMEHHLSMRERVFQDVDCMRKLEQSGRSCAMVIEGKQSLVL